MEVPEDISSFSDFAPISFSLLMLLSTGNQFEQHFLQETEAPARRCSVKQVQLRIFKTYWKELCKSLFFNVIGKWLWRRCFLVNFNKFLKAPVSRNTSGWLLLKMLESTGSKVLTVMKCADAVNENNAFINVIITVRSTIYP